MESADTGPEGGSDPVGERLAQVDALGGFFRLQAVQDVGDGDHAWRPLGELAAPAGLRRRAGQARWRLADRVIGPAGAPTPVVDARAAASTMHLGLVARLVSPVLAAGVLGLPGQGADPGAWLWRDPDADEPVLALGLPVAGPSAVHRPAGGHDGPAGTIGRLVDVVLLPIEASLHEVCRVPLKVLRGNLASALAGAAAVLAPDPVLGRPARDVVRRALRLPVLVGAGRYEPEGGFRRASCCLYYRLPGGGLCGDCVLARRRSSRIP